MQRVSKVFNGICILKADTKKYRTTKEDYYVKATKKSEKTE